jgi:glycerol-3-phosphate acyltransferase PlsX
VIPTLNGRGAVLLDVGANAECRPDHLVQFAIMGHIYARMTLGIRNPRVGLISIGEEQLKGNELTRETHKLLEKADLNFIGNVEGQDMYSGNFDVIVCDGFTGNVILKSGEGLYEMLIEVIRQELAKSMQTKVGAILSRPAFQNIKRRFDYAESGGAPLLGVRETCIICHGRSDARAIKNAIRIAKGLYERKATQKIEAEIMKFERQHVGVTKDAREFVS